MNFNPAPAAFFEICLVFLLSFLLGFEREEHKGEDASSFFGGVRVYPLIGLLGYVMAKAGESYVPYAAGLIGLASLLCVYYARCPGERGGLASEITALLAYSLGPLVCLQQFWAATALVVLVVILLELKKALEGLPKKVSSEEFFTFTKFLLLAAVILPVVPNESFTPFLLNPFKTALVVVVISGISYGAYILERFIGPKGGILASAFLGGAYSSTITTLVLAKRSQEAEAPRLISGSILVASGMMYLRLLVVLFLLSPEVAARLLVPFLSLGLAAALFGFFWAKQDTASVARDGDSSRNPLQLQSALLFAFLFVVTAVLTKLAQEYLGNAGIYGLSVLSGISDVDPYIMSVSQSVTDSMTVDVVRVAIMIATVSNNLLKATYTFGTARGAARTQGTILLGSLSAAGILAFFFF